LDGVSLILSELAPLVNMQHGVFYITETAEQGSSLKLLASYAIASAETFRTNSNSAKD